MDKISITLGSKVYEAARLTLRQARALGIGAAKIAESKEGAFAASLDHSISVVVSALEKDYSEVKADFLLDSQIGLAEIHAAADKILEFSGFMKKAQASGEIPAASTGKP